MRLSARFAQVNLVVLAFVPVSVRPHADCTAVETFHIAHAAFNHRFTHWKSHSLLIAYNRALR